MKRDMDYVRQLLLDIEAAPVEWDSDSSQDIKRDSKLYGHLRLLRDHGLISVGHHAVYHGGGELWVGVRLSWQGHEFLDNVRSPQVWAQTKEKVAATAGTVSLAVVSELAAQFARRLVGLP